MPGLDLLTENSDDAVAVGGEEGVAERGGEDGFEEFGGEGTHVVEVCMYERWGLDWGWATK